MADDKISALSTITGANIATTDEFVVVDKSDTTMAATGTDKKIVANELNLAMAAQGVVATDVIWDAAGDVVIGTGANAGARLAIGTSAGAALVADPNATNKASINYPQAVASAVCGQTSSLASNYDRANYVNTNINPLATGQLFLCRIMLPKGMTVTNMTWVSGTTALSAGTNQWFALFDSSRGKLAVTVDDTSTAWTGSTAKTLAMNPAFVTTYAGWYYAGIMIKATTPNSLYGIASLDTVIRNLAPIVGGSADGSLTNPASCPSTATAITVKAGWPYVEVS